MRSAGASANMAAGWGLYCLNKRQILKLFDALTFPNLKKSRAAQADKFSGDRNQQDNFCSNLS